MISSITGAINNVNGGSGDEDDDGRGGQSGGGGRGGWGGGRKGGRGYGQWMEELILVKLKLIHKCFMNEDNFI